MRNGKYSVAFCFMVITGILVLAKHKPLTLPHIKITPS
jgi:hypothetical protein